MARTIVKKLRNSLEEVTYTPVYELDSDAPLSFTFKPLNRRDRLKYAGKEISYVAGGNEIKVDTPSIAYDIFRTRVVSWNNLLDQDNNEIKPVKDSAGNLDESFLDTLGMDDLITEVGMYIKDYNAFTEEEEEKLKK